MEPITAIIIALAISLSGNLWQFNHAQDLKQDSEQWQHLAESNYQEWQEAIDVNDSNSSIITDLEKRLSDCRESHRETLDSIADHQEVGRIDRAVIAELKRKLAESNDSGDSDMCRVPAWVLIEIEGSARSVD